MQGCWRAEAGSASQESARPPAPPPALRRSWRLSAGERPLRLSLLARCWPWPPPGEAPLLAAAALGLALLAAFPTPAQEMVQPLSNRTGSSRTATSANLSGSPGSPGSLGSAGQPPVAAAGCHLTFRQMRLVVRGLVVRVQQGECQMVFNARR